MNRTTAKTTTETLKSLLKEFEEKTGLSVEIESTKYNDTDVIFKIRATELNAKDSYDKKSSFFGKVPYGTKVFQNGITFTVVDYKERATKFPYIIENSKGTRYKVSEDWVLKHKC